MKVPRANIIKKNEYLAETSPGEENSKAICRAASGTQPLRPHIHPR